MPINMGRSIRAIVKAAASPASWRGLRTEAHIGEGARWVSARDRRHQRESPPGHADAQQFQGALCWASTLDGKVRRKAAGRLEIEALD